MGSSGYSLSPAGAGSASGVCAGVAASASEACPGVAAPATGAGFGAAGGAACGSAVGVGVREHGHARAFEHHRLALAGGDHLVADRQALGDGDAARQAFAGGHDHAHGLAVAHDVDEAGVAFLHQRLLRDQDRRGPGIADAEADAREQARPQPVVGIVDAGAQAGAAAVDVDHRLDRRHLAGEGLAGEGIHGHLHRLAHGHPRQFGFGQAEVHFHRVQPHQVHQRLARAHDFADADFAQADDAAEGRDDRGLLQLRAGRRQPCLADAEFSAGAVHVRARQQLLAAQVAGAGVGAAGVLEVGLGFVDRRRGHRGVEAEQRLARVHALAFLEVDPDQAAGDFRPDHHRLVGAQGADGAEALPQRLQLHRDGLDLHRRHAATRRAAGRGRGLVAGTGRQGDEQGQGEKGLGQETAHAGNLDWAGFAGQRGQLLYR